jgi:hypothetical protein
MTNNADRNSEYELCYWTYAYDKASPTFMLQHSEDTYDEARAKANEWMWRGHALVHITEMQSGPTIQDGTVERLVWAGASPEVHWR